MKKTFLFVTCLALLCVSEASAQSLAPESFTVGVQLSHITYREPGLMRESGLLYGVNGAYTRIGRELMWKVDGTLAAGQVDYVGSYSDGTPLTIKGINDTLFEVRGMFGPTEFIYLSSYYLPYVGLGYRYLYDGANKGPGGYRRESNYVYVPLGVEGLMTTQSRWSVGFTAEYDLFVSGTQYSYLSDADPGLNDMRNTQSSGFGYRVSLKFLLAGKRDLIIEPYLKYWRIAQSDTTTITYYGAPAGSGYEPGNNSTELGIRVLLLF